MRINAEIPVLLTATSYPSDEADWRGRFIYDMAQALAATDQVDLSVWAPPGRLPLASVSALQHEDAVWLQQLSQQGGIAHLLRQYPLKGGVAAIGLLKRLRRVYMDFAHKEPSTVVHANWIQNALPLWGSKLPALITVLGSDLALLRFPGMVSMVRCMLRGRSAILAPNAEWMLPRLQVFFGDLAEIRAIPFGVQQRWFDIERREGAATSGEWLVVTRITRAKLGHLLSWGEGLFGTKRKLHLLGPMQESIALPSWIEYHGATNPDALAKDWFPRVSGLLTLSIHDEGRPQVIIEAMAAGLPIVASDLPAHQDLLQGGKLGCLVSYPEALQLSLENLEFAENNLQWGETGRRWVREQIGSWDDCAMRYVDAYQSLLEHKQ